MGGEKTSQRGKYISVFVFHSVNLWTESVLTKCYSRGFIFAGVIYGQRETFSLIFR